MGKIRGTIKKMGTLGKGVLAVTLILLLGGFIFTTPVGATDPRAYIYELHVYKMRALTTDPVGEIDFAGTPVINFEATPNITNLNSYTQLSTWANAGSGQSYYQASAGETVVVDPHAIYVSGGFGSGVVFSGVTIHAPLATSADNERIFRVEFVSTNGGGTAIASGATTVYVYGAPSSGVTDFGFEAAGTYDSGNIQNLQYNAGFNGLTTPEDELADHGDSKTWRLYYNSAVSAFIIAETNM